MSQLNPLRQQLTLVKSLEATPESVVSKLCDWMQAALNDAERAMFREVDMREKLLKAKEEEHNFFLARIVADLSRGEKKKIYKINDKYYQLQLFPVTPAPSDSVTELSI